MRYDKDGLFFRYEYASGLESHECHHGPFDTFPLACYLPCYEMTIWIVLMRIVGSSVNMPVLKEHGGECCFDSLVHLFTGLSYCDCVALRIGLTPDIYLFYGEYSSATIKRLMMLHYILGENRRALLIGSIFTCLVSLGIYRSKRDVCSSSRLSGRCGELAS